MDLRRDDLTRIARAPAKLNLFFDLLGRREDGFHEVETVMVPIRLADTVTFLPVAATEGPRRSEIRLDVQVCELQPLPQKSGSIPRGSENLVCRALRLLQERSGCELGARVTLVKRIPAAAGLGGGSSDAAAALKLANIGWQLHWSNARLAEVAAELGSDVPFFLSGGAAVCRGRGERTEQLPPIAPLHFVVVKPPVGLSTADVYRAYPALAAELFEDRAGGVRLADFISEVTSGARQRFVRHMRNALEKAASSLSPWVDKLRMAFDELDFLGHQLSGSGSAYFGVCRHARRLAGILRTRQLGLVYATRSCP
jgi:4-diphosphocytidyl-2-C-methyl-D-erythritol kinase